MKSTEPTDSTETTDVPDAEKRAFQSFQVVLDNAKKIEVDHYLVYYTRTSFFHVPFPFDIRDEIICSLLIIPCSNADDCSSGR